METKNKATTQASRIILSVISTRTPETTAAATTPTVTVAF